MAVLGGILLSLLIIVAIVRAGEIGEIDANDFDRYENQTEQQFLAYGFNLEISKKMTDLLFDFAIEATEYCDTQSQTVIDKLDKSPEIFNACVVTILNEAKNKKDESPWKILCQRKPMFMKCVEDFTTIASEFLCIRDEDKIIVDFVHNFVATLFSFICTDDGKRIYDMLELGNHPRRCFEDKKEQEAQKECINMGMLRRTIAATHLKDIATFNAADCRDFEGIYQCMKNNLKNCKDDRVIPMLRSIHKAADGITHCSKGGSVAAQKSSASAVAVYLQFLLLPALITSF